MDLKLDTGAKIVEDQTETYVAFRTAVPKPSDEDAHLRHILRFYIARTLLKRGEQEVFVLPTLTVDGKVLRVDLAAGKPGKYSLAICEPGSITPETEELLEVLRGLEGVDVIIVHSQYGKPGHVMERFKPELESKKFHLLAVVPPPFDDAYEYDIWMFETTFRNLFEAS
jgi:hypothetical protein